MVSGRFFPFLKYVVTEALPSSLMGMALVSGRSVLKLAGIGSIRHGGSFSQLLTEATAVGLLLQKTFHPNPIHRFLELLNI